MEFQDFFAVLSASKDLKFVKSIHCVEGGVHFQPLFLTNAPVYEESFNIGCQKNG